MDFIVQRCLGSDGKVLISRCFFVNETSTFLPLVYIIKFTTILFVCKANAFAV